MTDCLMFSREPRVTIVIVNWNKRPYVIKLLDSLRTIEYGNYTIVLVDNASTDDSVAAIKEHELAVTLLENKENLGGTGGFNTGILYALRTLAQDYIWLLDNDAEVLPDTLKMLVAHLECDDSIGIAGSCIMSPEDRDLIVEAGAYVGWKTGTSNPHLRYQRRDSYQGERVIDVDSVAACSALVRDSVARRVGLMDERFFLHWDDIDYCLRIRNAGFRVVALLDAPAFHVAEKGYNPAISYYNFRNSLLFLAKHRTGVSLALSLFNVLGNYLALSVYLRLSGRRNAAANLFSALLDFLGKRFGGAGSRLAPREDPGARDSVQIDFIGRHSRVLVFAVGSFDDVAATIRCLKESGHRGAISIAVSADRAIIYNLPEVDSLITYDLFSSRLSGKLSTAWKIVRGRFDCGITAGDPFVMPYAYFLPKNVYFDRCDGSLRPSGVSRLSLWKAPVAMICGKLLAVFSVLPVVVIGTMLRSSQENHGSLPE
ncbi:MAG TPA: glycosyltransferase family 2 protein [Geobacteraceae bacterium]